MLAVTGVAADFGASEGFSGKQGITCDACHRGGAAPGMQVVLEGLPDGWEYGETYDLVLRIEGGPPANPSPVNPEGGFDLEVDAGTITGDPALTWNPSPQELTYTAEGTLTRTWAIQWQAPPVGSPARGIGWWLASVAANGNHIIGQDDTQGETGDATAAIAGSVLPSPASVAAWRSLPVPPPVLGEPVMVDGSWRIQGSVEPIIDRVEARVDGAGWQEVGKPAFTLEVPAGVGQIQVRAWIDDRVSESVTVSLDVEEAPAPGALFFVAVFGLLAARSRRMP